MNPTFDKDKKVDEPADMLAAKAFLDAEQAREDAEKAARQAQSTAAPAIDPIDLEIARLEAELRGEAVAFEQPAAEAEQRQNGNGGDSAVSSVEGGADDYAVLPSLDGEEDAPVLNDLGPEDEPSAAETPTVAAEQDEFSRDDSSTAGEAPTVADERSDIVQGDVSAPGETPTVAGDDASGLFDDEALAPITPTIIDAEIEAEHARMIAAGERLAGIARESGSLDGFDDLDDALAQPFAVDEQGQAVVPIDPAVPTAQQETTEKIERPLSVHDKTEITAAPDLEARLAARKGSAASRVGMETGEFDDDSGPDGDSPPPGSVIVRADNAIAPKDLRVGDMVAGTYEVTKRLSSGGMGALYAAHDNGLDRDVAVKVILKLSERPDEAKEQVDRFRAEGNAMAKVAHEGLAQVYGTGVWNGTPYLIMELCRGGDLKEQIAAHGLPSGKHDSTTRVKSDSSTKNASGVLNLFDALKVGARKATQRLRREDIRISPAMQAESAAAANQEPQDPSWTIQGHTSLIKKLAGALSMVHKQGVVHRDLKPANVMYVDAERTRPVVIDFGLVPIKNERQGVILGTPVYMSPEQALSDQSLDQRSDIYSLGAIFYELVTRKLPYQDASKAKNATEVIERIITSPLTPAKELNPAVDAELSAIIDKAMAKSLLMDKVAIREQVTAEFEARSDFAELSDAEKALVTRERFDEVYAKQYASKKKSAEGTEYRYESMDELIADLDRYEKGLPVSAMIYDQETRERKERIYWEKMNPEEAQAKREEERKAKQWQKNKRRAAVGAAALVLAWMGYRVNEWRYGRNAQSTVNQAHASVAALSERAKRDGVANISTDLSATVAQVSSAESLVGEWVVRQRSADAAQGQVLMQEDRKAVDSIADSLRKYEEAKRLLVDYRKARAEESDFARAYQVLFRAYELSHEAVAEEAGSRGLDEVRARALVEQVDRLRNDAVARRLDYSREQIEQYRLRMRSLYRARFLRQLPGGEAEFTRETAKAGESLHAALENPTDVILQRVAVSPEMRSGWSRLEYQAQQSAEELERELRGVPGLEQGIVLGARAERHKQWSEHVEAARNRLNNDQDAPFFDDIRSQYRALRLDASLSDEDYLRRGQELEGRVNEYVRRRLEPAPEAPAAPEKPKRRVS